MRLHLLIIAARASAAMVTAWLLAAAYLPHAPGRAPILGAAWADHEDCDCQYSDNNRGCAVVADGLCTDGWVEQCETTQLNPPGGTCIKTESHPCSEISGGNNDCGFIVNEHC